MSDLTDADLESGVVRLRARIADLETRSVSAAGRRGGESTRRRLGVEFLRRIGQLRWSRSSSGGGEKLRDARGCEHYAVTRKRGGERVKAARGSAFFQRIGRLGGEKVRDTLGREHFQRAGEAASARRWGERAGRLTVLDELPGPVASPARLREARARAGLFQLALALRSGVSEPTISLDERGASVLRSGREGRTVALAEALGVDVSELV